MTNRQKQLSELNNKYNSRIRIVDMNKKTINLMESANAFIFKQLFNDNESNLSILRDIDYYGNRLFAYHELLASLEIIEKEELQVLDTIIKDMDNFIAR